MEKWLFCRSAYPTVDSSWCKGSFCCYSLQLKFLQRKIYQLNF